MSHKTDHTHRVMLDCVQFKVVQEVIGQLTHNVADAPDGFRYDIENTTDMSLEEFLNRLEASLEEAGNRPWPIGEVNLEDLPTVSFN